MSTIRLVGAGLTVALLASPIAAAPPPDDTTRAHEVLAQARLALGGQGGLAGVRALSMEGELRRRLPGSEGAVEELAGTVRVDALLPQRYLRVDTLSPVPGMPGIPLASGLDGDQAWGGPLPVASAPHMFIRTAPLDDPAVRARFEERVRRESALFVLATVLAADEASGTVLTWVGEAEAPEGRADILHVTGGAGLDARLFIDQKTHRPLMLTFREQPPRMIVRRAGPAEPSPRGSQGPDLEPPSTPPPPSEATLFLSDWKNVAGVLLPHVLNKTLDGKPYEEIVVSRYLVNDPKLTVDKFKKRV